MKKKRLKIFEFFAQYKASFLGALASMFEWYDYALFGYFATIIGQQFFPATDPVAGLLSSFAILASGFLMRPLGAVLFGYIGDQIGRKKPSPSLTVMAIPTTGLGLLPTYDTIGLGATIGLVTIRLLQGVAVGGNYGGSFIFTIENSPPGRKGLAGSLAMFGTLGGLFLGSGVAWVLNATLTPEDLQNYGWRIPFLLGIFSAAIAYFIHNKTPESSPKEAPIKAKRFELLKRVLSEHRHQVLQAMGVILLDGVGVYILFVFMTSYAQVFLALPGDGVLLSNTLSMSLLVASIPIFGWLGDRITQGQLLRYASLGFVFFSIPLFSTLIYFKSLVALALLQGVFALIIGAAYGALPAFVISLFPRSIRYTACGLAFNLSVAIFGGTAPYCVTALIRVSHWLLVPGLILTLVGVMSYISVQARPKAKYF